MTRNALFSLAFLVICLATTGCRATHAANSITLQAGAEPVLEIPNPALDAYCQITKAHAEVREGDLLHGWVTLRSHRRKKLAIEVRWRWYDADGVQLTAGGGVESWQPAWLNAEEEKQFQGNATAPEAYRCRFEIRRPRKRG